MTALDSFLTGSYVRHTLISPLKEADIDVFVVLATDHYNRHSAKADSQAGLLDELKVALRQTYSRTPDISRNGQAVTIRFSDFLVDVIPAFNRRGGGYLIANSISKTWIATDPKVHVKLVADANALHNGDFVPVIKMIKAWNREHGRFFQSFHLEVLALQIFHQMTISDFPSGVRFFFQHGRGLISKKNADPAGYADDVGAYINTEQKVSDAVAKFEWAFQTAVRAESAFQNERPRESITAWRTVFGESFPAFGSLQ